METGTFAGSALDELRPALWTWTASHPDWDEQPVVRSYAVERGGLLVLVDPMSPPAEVLAGRDGLLDLPVDLVLPTRGDPARRDALERALA